MLSQLGGGGGGGGVVVVLHNIFKYGATVPPQPSINETPFHQGTNLGYQPTGYQL